MSNREQRTLEKKEASRESASRKRTIEEIPKTILAGIDKELLDLEKRIEALERKAQ